MALPILNPLSSTSSIILPEIGSMSNITTSSLPNSLYLDPVYWTTEQIDSFRSGALDQTTYVYRMLGGDVLDIELTEKNVYAAYEAACLEYSYIINTHQSKNVLPFILGYKTGSFDSQGQLTGSDISGNVHIELKLPKFSFGILKSVSQAVSEEVSLNGTETVYSASFEAVEGQQTYDLQTIISASALTASNDFYGKVNDKRILIKKVYYKTPASGWNFYGYFGGVNTIGNLSSYGQYSDDSTFEIIPVWQNKLQAIAYKDAVHTRLSHYSYDLRNNKLRLYPSPRFTGYTTFWIEFVIPSDPWESPTSDDGTPYSNSRVDGINNMNTIPFQNIPYDKINSIGKQWIRRYCLELCKETLGQIRSKFDRIPIPGDSITLNGPALIQQAESNKEKLREELKGVLSDLVYSKLGETTAKIMEDTNKAQTFIPNIIFVG